ncbi:hypothetical protein AMQ84_27580 [Paenibacillus riograndensis]|uniref:Peptidase M24 domain-containing protein n=1 Tax=Paenibacillus riograndensis TaxID=483937 RepID=A0A132TKE8_9BACL|nr:hypothetical protein AMQ84_27580 [Paenibacillus riograndensis]
MELEERYWDAQSLDYREHKRLTSAAGLITSSFAANTIMTVEPGLYLPGIGGVRMEDDVLVGTDASRVLTRSPKSDLIVLP